MCISISVGLVVCVSLTVLLPLTRILVAKTERAEVRRGGRMERKKRNTRKKTRHERKIKWGWERREGRKGERQDRKKRKEEEEHRKKMEGRQEKERKQKRKTEILVDFDIPGLLTFYLVLGSQLQVPHAAVTPVLQTVLSPLG